MLMHLYYLHRQAIVLVKTQRENEMIKPTLENFDNIWIKTSQDGKRTACIVKVEGFGDYAKHWKKQIKLSLALEMIKSMSLEWSGSAVQKIEVYK